MITRLLRTSAFLAAFAIALPVANAQDFVATGAGSAIPDFNVATGFAGTATSVITITEEDSITIDDLSVTINGLNHTWAGDLISTITHTDLDGNSTVATLFNRIGRGDFPGDGDASNFDGDYEFGTTGASIWEESARGSSGNGTQGTIDDDFVIAPGRYANVNSGGFDNNTNPNVPTTTSLQAIFSGIETAGTWTIFISDNDLNDIGSFAGTTIAFDGVSVAAIPEPGTFGLMAVASVGGFFYVRRKKNAAEAAEEQTS